VDPSSRFSVINIRDGQRQAVRFDTWTNSLIWIGDGHSFPGYPVSDSFIEKDKKFEVRFGTKGWGALHRDYDATVIERSSMEWCN
jgi:hypothetical protein